MAQIAIVGGGPSGAMCGEQLARAGHKVDILDEHLAWEKPCGGGLTHKAIQCFPFLLDNSYPKKLVDSVDLISSEEHRATLNMPHPIVIYSRTVLNGLLLDRAKEAGCKVERSRVMGVETETAKPRYCVDNRWREADFLVLAAGARNQLLPETRALQRDELEMTQGYFVPQTADAITIKFLPHFEGYIWSFPRCDHLSVGICGSMASHTSAELRRHLQTFVEKQGISTEGAKFYSHVLPSPQERTLSQRNVVGKNWALIGDAAAWVDPLTGEGLFYAIRSGELLGRSLAEGCPEKYPAWVRATFSAELEFAARIVRRFYRGSFLGSAVTTRMVQFIRRSPVFQQLMGDLFSGTQDYSTLKRRLWGHLGITISEFIASVLNLDHAARARVPRPGATGD
ncbi:MAG TPA: NAD(P)/FAD-dependent oxidoreductase [Candidatus Udaeobacter sp.]|jgi:flavin-dependent dehydrogenase|nr:NAD(P)/FAD-dependent oxidoreductase [Candidatus Udaeobacter sp.]